MIALECFLASYLDVDHVLWRQELVIPRVVHVYHLCVLLSAVGPLVYSAHLLDNLGYQGKSTNYYGLGKLLTLGELIEV